MPEGITVGEVVTHVSNNHIFPANENIYNAVAGLEKDGEVLLSGYLVDVMDFEGNRMTTSMTRSDSDAGACECFYVNYVQVGGRVYE